MDLIEDKEKFQTQGWHRLSLTLLDSGHAIAAQLNSRSGEASLMDPNMGLLCFRKEGDDYATVKARFIEFFNDLIALYYSDIYMIEATEHSCTQ